MSAVFRLDLPEAPSPVEALDRLAGLPGRVLLESAAPPGRRSILSADPLRVLVGRGGQATLLGPESERLVAGSADPFALLREVLSAGPDGARREPPPGEAGPFGGGWIGFLGYELGGLLERLPPPPPDDVGVPDLWLGEYDWWLVWESGRAGARLEGRTPAAGGEGRPLEPRLQAVVRRIAGQGPSEDPGSGALRRRIRPAMDPDRSGRPRKKRLGGLRSSPPGGPLGERGTAWTSLPEEAFREGVERIRSWIRAGDLFQANLTHRISRAVSFDGPTLYRRLRAASPSAHSAFLDLGEVQVASVSPETFLSLRGSDVETRPIKGTAPRSTDPEADRAAAEALLQSTKDRAENVMIVDLLRNDLSRVCRPGSVQVPHLAELESHPTVHHLVSTVRGRLEPGVDVVDLLRATFPGGSITGAPKIRAMEVLAELEPVRRGVYTGALGYVTFGGDAELSVAIRTAVLRDGIAHYGTGGGITLASDPRREWAESLAKARAFLEATEPDETGAERESPQEDLGA